MIAIFVGAVGNRLPDRLRCWRIKNVLKRLGHEIADVSRQPVTATDQHLAVRPDVEALEGQWTDELSQIAIIVAGKFFQARRNALTFRFEQQRVFGGLQVN